MTKLHLLILLALLTACGSPSPRLPAAIQQTQTLEKDARRALQSGDLLRAQSIFTNVLTLQQSLDNMSASAVTMLNLATVAHQLHDQALALAWLDKIILEQAGIFPREARVTAFFRKAVILTDADKFSEATLLLQSAENLCGKKCAESFGIQVLQARLFFLEGEVRKAYALTIALNKQSTVDHAEFANVVRIRAAAEEKLELNAEAFSHFQIALEMDRALALSKRISEDLLGLSRVANKLGKTDDAAIYSRRAELLNDSKSKMMPLKAKQNNEGVR